MLSSGVKTGRTYLFRYVQDVRLSVQDTIIYYYIMFIFCENENAQAK